MFSGHGGPGGEIADGAGGVTIGELGECFTQPCMRIDAGDIAVLNERGDHRPVVAAFVGAGTQGVFSVERKGANLTFGCIAVEVHAAIVEEPERPSQRVRA